MLLPVAALLAMTASAPALADAGKTLAGTMEEYPIPAELDTSIIEHRWRGTELYVVDSSHRITVVNGKDSRRIGGVGNKKGEFYYIEGLAIEPDGTLFVRDAGNKRIQVSDQKQNFVTEFVDTPKSLGFAVVGGRLLLGQPALGKVVASYDRSGKRLGTFGDLQLPSDLAGPRFKEHDQKLKISLNRVWIVGDAEGNVWIARLHAPVVSKFNAAGDQVFQKELSVPEIEPLKEAVFTSPPPTKYGSINYDGIQLTFVIKDLVFDPSRKEVLVLLGDERIVALGMDGKERYSIKLRLDRGTVRTISVDGNGQIFASKYGSTKLYRVSVPGR